MFKVKESPNKVELHLDMEDLQACLKVSTYKGSQCSSRYVWDLSITTGMKGCNLYFVIGFLQLINFYD